MFSNIIRPGAFADLTGLAEQYQTARPFPHLVIDDFLSPEIADEVHDEVRRTASNVSASNEITQKQKTACTDWDEFETQTGRLISYLNSSKFIGPLEKITGLNGLLGDPALEGGGIHQTTTGGFLKMHTDFNWNAHLRLDRRINILLYFNKEWKKEYRGELIISDLGKKDQKVIEPLFNRLVIFNTNDSTLHGHPFPLKFPEDYPRCSVAMYYYTAGVAVKERWRRKATTTRYVPLETGDIDWKTGSLRSRLGYLVRRFTPF